MIRLCPYRIPQGESLLSPETPLGHDEHGNPITARVETCAGHSAFHERVLIFKDHHVVVEKLCAYTVPQRNAGFIRVVILVGSTIQHTARGDGQQPDAGRPFHPEDFTPFTSAKDALAYARSWVRGHFVVPETAEVLS